MAITDIHAHILPGIDDGARDMEEMRRLLRKAYEQGIRNMIATPHFHIHRCETETERIYELTALAQVEADEVAPGMRIYPGEEILYFNEMAEALAEKKVLTLAGSRYVLVEFMPSVGYSSLMQAVRNLILAGYLPVLAHVERYGCLRKEDRMKEIAEAGVLFQMNLTSLCPQSLGIRELKELTWCRRAVLSGRIHLLATDMHRMDYRPPECERAFRWLRKAAGEMAFDQLLEINPEKIVAGKTL